MNNEDIELNEEAVEQIIKGTVGLINALRSMIYDLQNEQTSMFRRYIVCVRLLCMSKFLDTCFDVQSESFKYGYLVNSELLRKNGGIESNWIIEKEDLNDCPLFTKKTTPDEAEPSLIVKLVKH